MIMIEKQPDRLLELEARDGSGREEPHTEAKDRGRGSEAQRPPELFRNRLVCMTSEALNQRP
jgi:hypothetical protein